MHNLEILLNQSMNFTFKNSVIFERFGNTFIRLPKFDTTKMKCGA